MKTARWLMLACCLLSFTALARLFAPDSLPGLDWLTLLGLTLAPGIALTLLSPPLMQSTLRNILFYSLLTVAGGVFVSYLLRSLGLDARACLVGLVVPAVALSAFALYFGRRYSPIWLRDDLPLAGLTAALVAVSYCAMAYSFESLNSWDGLWHAACGVKALSKVPPENPVFAGGAQYLYWAYNLYVAQVGLLVKRSFTETALALNLLGASTMVVTAYEITRYFVTSPRWRYLATLLVVCGVNALGSLWLLARIVTGQRTLQAYLTGDALSALAVKYNWNNNYLNLPSLVPGGAGVGIPLLMAVIFLCCADLNNNLRRRSLPAVSAALAGCLLCHPISGAVAGLVIGAAVVTRLAMRQDAGPLGLQRFGLALAGALGLAAAWSYSHAISAPFQQPTLFLNFSDAPRLLTQAWDFVGPWLWAVLLVPLGLVSLWRQSGLKSLVLIIPAAVLVVLAVTVRLPWDNQYKFVYLQAPFIAIIAVHGLSSLRSTWLRRAAGWTLLGTVILTLVVSLLILRLRYDPKPYAYAPSGAEIALVPTVVPDDAAFCRYLRSSTPAEAVVIEAPGGIDEHVELLNVPLIGHRTGFTATAGDWTKPSPMEHWMTGGYRDCELRETIANKLSRGEALEREHWTYLTNLGRPLYLLLRRGNRVVKPQAETVLQADQAHFRRVYDGGSLRLYQVTPR